MSCFSESFLSEIPEKASESFLSEVVFPKLFRPKVFDFNVTVYICLHMQELQSPICNPPSAIPHMQGLNNDKKHKNKNQMTLSFNFLNICDLGVTAEKIQNE